MDWRDTYLEVCQLERQYEVWVNWVTVSVGLRALVCINVTLTTVRLSHPLRRAGGIMFPGCSFICVCVCTCACLHVKCLGGGILQLTVNFYFKYSFILAMLYMPVPSFSDLNDVKINEQCPDTAIVCFGPFSNNNNKQICIAPYGRNFRGAETMRQCTYLFSTKPRNQLGRTSPK